MNLIILAEINKNYINPSTEFHFSLMLVSIFLLLLYRHSLSLFIICLFALGYIANSSAFFSLYIVDLMEVVTSGVLIFFFMGPMSVIIKAPNQNT